MPKYSYDEATLREYAQEYAEGTEENEGETINLEDELAKAKRDADGMVSFYEEAKCALNEKKLSEQGRLVLQELRRLSVTRLVVRYDGGGDEGFAYFKSATTENGDLDLTSFSTAMSESSLGNAPDPSKSRYPIANLSREQWVVSSIEGFMDELAIQLLGYGYGTGEYSLEGSFVADFQTNTLTDIAPEKD